MIAVVTVLFLPAGLLCRRRSVAMTAYCVAYLWAFVFQTLYLALDSWGRSSGDRAFEPREFPLSYGITTLGVLLVGLALLEVGHRTGRRVRQHRVRGRGRVSAVA